MSVAVCFYRGRGEEAEDVGQVRQRPSPLQRWRRLYRRDELKWFPSLLLALFCVAVATGARLLLGLIGPTLAFATFFPAVMVCALVGGRRAGLLSVLLSIVAVWWAFIDPYYSFGALNRVTLANFVVFSVSSLAIIWLALVHRQAVFDLENNEHQRQILANEILHRSRNTAAVIGSIVRQTVSDKNGRDAALSRISVIAGNRDPLETSCATDLQELLDTHVGKAHGKQILLKGGPVALTAEQSRSLALVFHELSTNAVKYGALSERHGKVTIEWTHADGVLTIVWTEADGPIVLAPAKLNFGSTLITSMLDQIGARLEPTFASSGYRYLIRIPANS
jgi:two-component sensor histidine kinase